MVGVPVAGKVPALVAEEEEADVAMGEERQPVRVDGREEDARVGLLREQEDRAWGRCE